MINKGLAVIVILLFIGMSVVPSTAITESKDVSTVDFNGDTLYVGGSGPNNYTTIQSAIDNSSDGDTVFVYDDSSPYHENVIINYSIDLIGENKNTTIIKGHYTGFGAITIENTNDVCVTSFTIQNRQGMDITGYNTISNNNIYSDNDGIGIYVQGEQNLIQNNYISNTDMGIWINSYGNIVKNNTFHLNGWGLYIDLGGNNNIIFGNILSTSRSEAIWIFSDNNNITLNTLSNNSRGILLSGGANNNIILRNNISSNNWEGIGVHPNAEHTIISGNIISHNSYGIILYTTPQTSSFSEASYTIIRNNDIHNNSDRGISVANNKNIIEMNNIKDNKRNARFLNCVNNTWDSNYWGRSFNTPYPIFGRFGIITNNFCFIPWINIDWNPAQEPYDIRG